MLCPDANASEPETARITRTSGPGLAGEVAALALAHALASTAAYQSQFRAVLACRDELALAVVRPPRLFPLSRLPHLSLDLAQLPRAPEAPALG